MSLLPISTPAQLGWTTCNVCLPFLPIGLNSQHEPSSCREEPWRNLHSYMRGHEISRAISDSTPITVRAILPVGCEHTSDLSASHPARRPLYDTPPRCSLRDSVAARRLGLLPGSLAIHPVTLRRSTTPDDPLRLAAGGASGAAPGRLTPKASSLYRFRGLPRRFITCCLRFTTGVAARHARLASGWRAAPLPGGSRTRWTATRGFRSCHPPLQGFAWRNKRPVAW